MAKKNNSVDVYIAKSKPFARPILENIRALVHIVCPDCEEKMKWSFPHFDYCGQMMCSMAAFNSHAAFGFWKESLLKDPKKILAEKVGMGSLGKLQSLSDLPSDKLLTGFIKQAMKLNESGIKVTKPKAKPVNIEAPDYLVIALKKNPSAKKTFAAFSPSNKRDYIEWLTDAKTEETCKKRLKTAVEWMSEGKTRNWKYLRKNNSLGNLKNGTQYLQ